MTSRGCGWAVCWFAAELSVDPRKVNVRVGTSFKVTGWIKVKRRALRLLVMSWLQKKASVSSLALCLPCCRGLRPKHHPFQWSDSGREKKHCGADWWNSVQCSYHLWRSEPCGRCPNNLATLIDALDVPWKSLLGFTATRRADSRFNTRTWCYQGCQRLACFLMPFITAKSSQLLNSGLSWVKPSGRQGEEPRG